MSKSCCFIFDPFQLYVLLYAFILIHFSLLPVHRRGMIDEAAQKVTLPAIHRVLANDWDVLRPDKCIALLEAVGVVYPPSVAEGLIDLMVQPKIAAAVKAWSPTKDLIPIHLWLHPWLPLMRSKLAPYYPEIRRKLAQALSSWQPEDHSALSVIKPWRDVFDRDSMDKFLSRVIIPKLVVALRSLSINPQSQDIRAFNAVMVWYGVVPDIHIVSLFRGEFFSKWLRYDKNTYILS